ncbi:MAG: peptidoglycan endopeptidase, partial [Lactococcus sp.]
MNKKMLTLVVVGTVGLSSLALPFSAAAAVDDDINRTSQKISEISGKKDAAQTEIGTITDTIAKNEENSVKLVAEMKETQATLKTLTTEVT